MEFRRSNLTVAVILAGALLLRLFSFNWNYFPHGNVTENMRAAISVASEGSLKVAPASSEPYWYSTAKYGGRYLDLNAPLWSVAAGSIAYLDRAPLNEGAMFALFKIMSLITGVLVLFFSWRLARRLAGDRAAIFALGVLSLSFILIDYSSNGAFYMAQALIYLLLATAAFSESRFRLLILGFLSGIGWLLNYQAAVMIAATVILIFWEEPVWKLKIRSALIAILAFSAVISPLLIRNYAVFGNPMKTSEINLTYLWGKAGFEPVVEGDVKFYEISFFEKLMILKSAVAESLPHNAYYMARKLFVILPITFIFFIYGAIDVAFSGEARRKLLPILILVSAAFLQLAVWPMVQFRYFVPILPLVAVLAAEYFFRISDGKIFWQKAGISAMLASTVLVSFLMYNSNPLHVCYYDCAVTKGPLGRNEELMHLKASGLIP